MATDEETLRRRYREFLELMPLTISIAGLLTSQSPFNFSADQMEVRITSLCLMCGIPSSNCLPNLPNLSGPKNLRVLILGRVSLTLSVSLILISPRWHPGKISNYLMNMKIVSLSRGRGCKRRTIVPGLLGLPLMTSQRLPSSSGKILGSWRAWAKPISWAG